MLSRFLAIRRKSGSDSKFFPETANLLVDDTSVSSYRRKFTRPSRTAVMRQKHLLAKDFGGIVLIVAVTGFGLVPF